MGVIIIPISVFSQVFSKGSQFISVGYGVGNVFSKYNYGYYKNYQASSFGPLMIAYEKSMFDNEFKGKNIRLGDYNGFIGLGGVLYYNSYRQSWYNEYNYDYKLKSIGLMARAAYHTDFDVPNLDVYGGLGVGFRYYSYKINSLDPSLKSSTDVGLIAQIYFGGRYFLTDRLGLFLEGGLGSAFANFGVTFKL